MKRGKSAAVAGPGSEGHQACVVTEAESFVLMLLRSSRFTLSVSVTGVCTAAAMPHPLKSIRLQASAACYEALLPREPHDCRQPWPTGLRDLSRPVRDI